MGVDKAQLKEGERVESFEVESVLRSVVGCGFEHELIAVTPWNAGYALVADNFRRGRLFVAGDAAHLFTPTGGMGYNTSIVVVVVNLGWKLAGVVHGWGPDALLDSYEAERRPIAMRNTAFARAMADSIGRLPVPDSVELDGAVGAQARSALGGYVGGDPVVGKARTCQDQMAGFEGTDVVADEGLASAGHDQVKLQLLVVVPARERGRVSVLEAEHGSRLSCFQVAPFRRPVDIAFQFGGEFASIGHVASSAPAPKGCIASRSPTLMPPLRWAAQRACFKPVCPDEDERRSFDGSGRVVWTMVAPEAAAPVRPRAEVIAGGVGGGTQRVMWFCRIPTPMVAR